MKYFGHRRLLCKLTKLSKFNAFNEHWGIYSCLQIPPRENWFRYVRRVYATAINFPCITFLAKLFFLINQSTGGRNSQDLIFLNQNLKLWICLNQKFYIDPVFIECVLQLLILYRRQPKCLVKYGKHNIWNRYSLRALLIWSD